MPVCHGAGGLAAHYQFGARTNGSNLIIGGLFVLLALTLGSGAVNALHLLPMGVLGVLLFFAGSQLALTILDMKSRTELFVVVVMLGITLTANLAWLSVPASACITFCAPGMFVFRGEAFSLSGHNVGVLPFPCFFSVTLYNPNQ